ncbi:MAG: hypothetical protein KF846_08440 [Cyclobacteriaceae bacterium]|nr:hypothetical protein [Cyclobacteriaceae bacterium]
MKRPKYSIKQVRDKDGMYWDVAVILNRPSNDINRIRTECYEAHTLGAMPPFVCAYCHKPVWLPATIVREHHFKHFHYDGIEECVYYSGGPVSIEYLNARKYNGIKEGRKHIEFKELILRFLNFNPSISELQCESVVTLPKFEKNDYRREWRKPDINGRFNGIHFALELQFSTTWLREIVGRTLFYRKLGYFLLWVFDKFYPEYTNREIAYSDIFCNNNENAFVFDEECYRLSEERQDLVLKCFYSKYVRDGFETSVQIVSEKITFNDLCFDRSRHIVYYYDSLGEKSKIETEIRREEEKIETESKRQLEAYQRAEKNKEFDTQIEKASSSQKEYNTRLDTLKEEAMKINIVLQQQEVLDLFEAAKQILFSLQNNNNVPGQYCKLIDENMKINFSNRIKSELINIERRKMNRDHLERLLASLKMVSRKKLQGTEFVVIPRDKMIFDEFYQSIYYVRRIELETSVLKPNPQRISFPQISSTFINNNEFVFLIPHVVFERSRRGVSARIASIQVDFDSSAILGHIEYELRMAKMKMLEEKTEQLKRLQLTRAETEEIIASLKDEVDSLVNRKRMYNSDLVF